MLRKRCTAVVLILTMLMMSFSLAGCGKKNSNNNNRSTKVENTPTEGLTGTPTPTVPADDKPPKTVTEPRQSDVMTEGYTTNGFRVIGRTAVNGLDGTAVFLEHEKTGARLMYVDCDDKELTFGAALRTPAANDKGTAHILEHCVLSGSEKYPDRNLFTDLLANSYTTELNAYTAKGYTFFPAASYSEEQLAALMDVYMDGILHPLVLKDKNIFLREVRLELEDANEPLSAKGILFNEMSNDFSTAWSEISSLMLRQTFPNGTGACIDGGYPTDTLQLSYEELLGFYEAYYHPSNMLLLLYGNFADADAFLKNLNENYLAAYEKREIVFPENDNCVAEGFTECVFEEKVLDAEGYQPSWYYTVALQDNLPETRMLAALLAEQLNDPYSVYKSSFAMLFPSGNTSVGCIFDAPVPLIFFYASGLQEEEKETFQQLVREMCAALSKKNTLDDPVLKAFLNQENYRIATLAEQSGVGVSMLSEAARRWTDGADWFAVNESYNAMLMLSDALQNGTFRNLLSEKVGNAENAVFLVTAPKVVETDDLGTVSVNYLATMKQTMSDEGKKALAEQTKSHREWVAAAAEDRFPEQLRVVTAESLSEVFTVADVQDTDREGIRYLKSEIADADTFSFRLYLDANGIPYESLLDTGLFVNMLGNMATEHYSAEKLRSFRMSKLNDISFELVRQKYTDAECHQYLVVEASGMKEQLEDTMEYISEVLTTSDMSDGTRLPYVAYEMFSECYTKVFANPAENLLLPLGKSTVSADDYLDYYLDTSQTFFAYLYEIITECDEEYSRTKMNKLKMIQSILLHSPGAIVVSVGSGDTVNYCEKAAAELLSGLKPTPVNAQNYQQYYKKWKNSKSTGIKLDGANMASNLKILGRTETGNRGNSEGKDYLAGLIVQNEILLPILRTQNNAYSAGAYLDDQHVILLSYADPNVSKTFSVFDSLGERIREMKLSEEQIEGAILYAASMLMQVMAPKGSVSAAEYTIDCILSHRDTNSLGNMLRDMKGFSQEDWLAYAEVFDALKEEGKALTVSDEETIDANASLYDEILLY